RPKAGCSFEWDPAGLAAPQGLNKWTGPSEGDLKETSRETKWECPLPFDFTWKMLKDKFNECGHVLYADIKMENGKSKGCGVVRFESPEVAERACRMMNGIQLRGREIDVRIDRNA
ncbi:putative Heterogeneous nuclear ribonucleoprotein, partial [Naja naja]